MEKVSTRSKLDIFNEYLESYQIDMVKIIGKHRRSNHPLTIHEISSEANFHLNKKRDEIISIDDFNEVNFKKIAYSYVKNAIKWSAYREQNSKHNVNILDKFHFDKESGELLTTYEGALTKSEYSEEDKTDIFDHRDRKKYNIEFFKTFISDSEKELIDFLLEDIPLKKIAEIKNISRQAIDFKLQDLKKKIKNHPSFRDGLNSKSLKDETYFKITEGKTAINDFFEKPPSSDFLDKDLQTLKEVLLCRPKSYTADEINIKYFDGKFTGRIISMKSRILGLHFLVLKKLPKSKFTQKEVFKIKNL